VRKRIDAVLCLIDTRMPAAAKLADRLGVRHLNPASAALMRDKFDVRCRLAERGLAQPLFSLATTNEGVKAAVEQLGLPVLIKPVDGYGSQNIVVLRYLEDLDPLLSPLDDLLPCNADYGLNVRSNDRLLVERFMSGTIIGCDTLTTDGRHQLLGINEKIFFEPPSFAIRGGCFTPNRPAFEAIERYLFSVLDAVGLDWGAAHTELMLTADGPRLIEINPRLVGAKIPRLIGYALNRSMHADLIALHTGEGLRIPTESATSVAVTRWIVAEQAGILDHVEMPQWHDPRIRCVELLKQKGDHIRPPFENADRIGYIMVCAATRSEAEQLADSFVSQCRCHFKHPASHLSHPAPA
ncbi:MAG TPA: ATP-grasp domain-containing protein, partial [Herbaspirillum sp.]|nr:ATP-grasp domain-containing protein [Herbaspirillum sp.]